MRKYLYYINDDSSDNCLFEKYHILEKFNIIKQIITACGYDNIYDDKILTGNEFNFDNIKKLDLFVDSVNNFPLFGLSKNKLFESNKSILGILKTILGYIGLEISVKCKQIREKNNRINCNSYQLLFYNGINKFI